MPIGFVADAGTLNGVPSNPTGGQVPQIGNSGRGIPRTGDIRHIGDTGQLNRSAGLIFPTGPRPGSIAQNVPRGPYEGPTNPPGAAINRNFDSQQENFNAYAGGPTLFCGKDGGGEGFDCYSSKTGSRTG